MAQTTTKTTSTESTQTYPTTERSASDSVWPSGVDTLYQRFVEENPEFESILREPEVSSAVKKFFNENRDEVDKSDLQRELIALNIHDDLFVNALVDFKKKNKTIQNATEFAVQTHSNNVSGPASNVVGSTAMTTTEAATSVDTPAASAASATAGAASEGVDNQQPSGAAPMELLPLPPFVDGFLRFFLGAYDGAVDWNSPGPVYNMATHDSEAVKLQTKTNYAAGKIDAEALIDQIAGAGGKDNTMLRSFGGMVPQILTVLDNPRVQAMLDTLEPGTADMVKTFINVFTGNKGSARDLNKVLNSGHYGEAAAQDILSIVEEFRDETTMKFKNGDPNNPKYTMGQLALTAKYAKEKLGITPEIVFGSTTAKNKISVLKDLQNLDDENIELFAALQNQYEKTLPSGQQYTEEDFYNALVYKPYLFTKTEESKKAYQALTKQVQERAKDPEKTAAGKAYYARLTEDMRLVGNAAMSIITPEEQQAFLKQAKGSEHDAAVLASQHYMSMYGNAGLRRGDMDLATQQASYVLNSAYWAGLNTQSLQEHAAAIYKSFGPDNATQANATIMGSLSTQAALRDAGMIITDNMRVQLDQRHADAESDPGSTRIAWFLQQKLNEDAPKDIKELQTALKDGKPLSKAQVDKLSEWMENASKFNEDMSSATGIAEGKVASATSAAYAEDIKSSLTNAELTAVNTAATSAKVNISNRRNYTEAGAASAAGAMAWTSEKLGNLGYENTEQLSSDFAILGQIGADPVAVLLGQKELTEEQEKAYKESGGNIDALKKRLETAKQKYTDIYKTKSDKLEKGDRRLQTLQDMGFTELKSMYHASSGETYIAPEVGLDDWNLYNTQKQQERVRDNANTDENRKKLIVQPNAFDVWSMGRWYGLGTYFTRGWYPPPENAAQAITQSQSEDLRVEALSGNQGVQALSWTVTKFTDVVKSLTEAIQTAVNKINGVQEGGTTATGGSPEREGSSTPEQPDGTTAQPGQVPPQPTGPTPVSQNASPGTNSISIASVSLEAANTLGSEIAKHLGNMPIQTDYNPTPGIRYA